jgi:transcriptional regulator with XRE-family HTH domain
MTRARRRPLADQLRQAIQESGMTLYRLSQESGVTRQQLSRFMRGERDLGLTIADKVCSVLGLDLTPPRGRLTRASRTRRKPLP